jgi:DNA-binding transcriptional LysR family regulator
LDEEIGKNSVKRSKVTRLHAHWIPYFVQVAQVGSIRRAAAVLNVSPSAVTRQIKDVEDILGVRLLERIPRGLRLTAAGEVVAFHANQVLHGSNQMESLLDELRGLRRGHVSIAAVQATAADLVPRIVTEFRRKNPRITFTCEFVGSSEVVDHVLAGKADLGISFNAPVSGALRHLIAVPLPFGAIMAPNHPLARHETLRLYEVAEAEIALILPDQSISTRSIVDRMLANTSLDLVPSITTSYPDFIVSAARLGAGIAFQTPVGIEQELRDGSLKFVPVVEARHSPPILSVLVAARRPLSLAASLVAEAARVGVAELLRPSEA